MVQSEVNLLVHAIGDGGLCPPFFIAVSFVDFLMRLGVGAEILKIK